MLEWLHQLHDPDALRQLIAHTGLWLIALIIFAETGVLAGFFLPGDSLLVVAGVLTALDPSAPTHPPLLGFVTTGVTLTVAAILGDALNFGAGMWLGQRIWQRPDGRFFKRRYLEEGHAFYERHGGLAVAAARFVPIARTFVPFAAGMARMGWRTFLCWNVAGGVLWIWSLLALGHWCGQQKALRDNLHLLIVVVVALSFAPLAIGVVRRWWTRRATKTR